MAELEWERLAWKSRWRRFVEESLDFLEVIGRRRSVRRYQQRPIEEEKIVRILEAMNSAPSAGDLQAYEVVAVEDARKRRNLALAAGAQDFIAEAPVVLVFLANPPRSGRKYRKRGEDLYSVQDATIACSYAQLTATAEGLGSCWVGAMHDEEVRRIVGAPEHLRPVAILTLGYPAEEPERTPRRNVEDLVRRESF